MYFRPVVAVPSIVAKSTLATVLVPFNRRTESVAVPAFSATVQVLALNWRVDWPKPVSSAARKIPAARKVGCVFISPGLFGHAKVTAAEPGRIQRERAKGCLETGPSHSGQSPKC